MSVWTASDTPNFMLPPAAAFRRMLGNAAARLAFRMRLPLALTGGLIGALSVLTALSTAPAPAPASEANTDIGAGVWTLQADAPATLGLEATAFAGLPRSTATWERTRTGTWEREERLTVGDVDRSDPFVLAIAVSRPSADLSSSLFLASARHAADAGLAIGRFTHLPNATGGQGLVEMGRVSLARAIGFGPVRNDCLAWRTARADGTLRVEGLACLPLDRPEPERVSCLLRDLAQGAGTEPTLRRGLLEAAGPAAASCDKGRAIAMAKGGANRKPRL